MRSAAADFTAPATAVPDSRRRAGVSAMRRKSIRLTWSRRLLSSATVPAPAPMNLPDTKDALLQSLNPEKTIKARVQASLTIAGGAAAARRSARTDSGRARFPAADV